MRSWPPGGWSFSTTQRGSRPGTARHGSFVTDGQSSTRSSPLIPYSPVCVGPGLVRHSRQRAPSTTRSAGRCTVTSSCRFGELKDNEDIGRYEVELRCSWTPDSPDLGAHLLAFTEVLCTMAGLPPRDVWSRVAPRSSHPIERLSPASFIRLLGPALAVIIEHTFDADAGGGRCRYWKHAEAVVAGLRELPLAGIGIRRTCSRSRSDCSVGRSVGRGGAGRDRADPLDRSASWDAANLGPRRWLMEHCRRRGR